jgi:ABC-type methionine transport system permease subunit
LKNEHNKKFLTNVINKATKPMEFSKKLSIWVLIACFFIICLILILASFANLTEGTAIGIGGIIMPIAVSIVGFYFNKAKAENLLKIGQNATSEDVEQVSTPEN